MFTPDQLAAIIGSEALDRSGEKLGTVSQLYLDDRTGAPSWVDVRSGLLGRDASFVPLDGATFSRGVLRLAVDQRAVNDAPRVDATDGRLSPEIEDLLYAHYRVADTGGQTASRQTVHERPASLSPDAAVGLGAGTGMASAGAASPHEGRPLDQQAPERGEPFRDAEAGPVEGHGAQAVDEQGAFAGAGHDDSGTGATHEQLGHGYTAVDPTPEQLADERRADELVAEGGLGDVRERDGHGYTSVQDTTPEGIADGAPAAFSYTDAGGSYTGAQTGERNDGIDHTSDDRRFDSADLQGGRPAEPSDEHGGAARGGAALGGAALGGAAMSAEHGGAGSAYTGSGQPERPEPGAPTGQLGFDEHGRIIADAQRGPDGRPPHAQGHVQPGHLQHGAPMPGFAPGEPEQHARPSGQLGVDEQGRMIAGTQPGAQQDEGRREGGEKKRGWSLFGRKDKDRSDEPQAEPPRQAAQQQGQLQPGTVPPAGPQGQFEQPAQPGHFGQPAQPGHFGQQAQFGQQHGEQGLFGQPLPAPQGQFGQPQPGPFGGQHGEQGQVGQQGAAYGVPQHGQEQGFGQQSQGGWQQAFGQPQSQFGQPQSQFGQPQPGQQQFGQPQAQFGEPQVDLGDAQQDLGREGERP